MVFLLSSNNVFDYLLEKQLCKPEDRSIIQIAAKEYKNFNLLVSFGADRHFLVKQERHDTEGNSRKQLRHEWQISEFWKSFPELHPILSLTSEIVSFDPDCSIIVLKYFADYCDLDQFYSDRQDRIFPVAIAASLGKTLATIHQSTFESQTYKEFLSEFIAKPRSPRFLQGLERVGPGVFSRISTDGLDFWRLYQRYDSLHQAMVEVCQTFAPCCLTHNDVRPWNVLLNLDWEQLANGSEAPASLVRLIDWEFCGWGDPACDLGMTLASYLQIWLRSLTISNAIAVETALRLAATPLELLQPSMVALIKAYFVQFPEILERRPNFFNRVMQFTGLILIKRIQGRLEHQGSFDNASICTMQVAKSLLCVPEKSVLNLFGITASELTMGCPVSV
jgi:Phosphotransferase enzyme family